MSLVVVLAQIVAVVGGHQRQARLMGQLDEPVVDDLLFFKAVGLQLKVEAIRKDLHVLFGLEQGIVESAVAQGGRGTSLQAGRQADEALGMGAQVLVPCPPGACSRTLQKNRRTRS